MDYICPICMRHCAASQDKSRYCLKMASVLRNLNNRRLVLLFIGPPGSGKGTYGKLVAERLGLTHISVGDLVREAIANRDEMGQKMKEFVALGKLVPDYLITGMFRVKLLRYNPSRIIIDGFPRTLKQAVELETYCRPDICVRLHLPDDIIIKKLLGRRICAYCGANFNVSSVCNERFYLPPILPRKRCEICNGTPKFNCRSDDTEDIILARITDYKKFDGPLSSFYRSEKRLLDFSIYRGILDTPKLQHNIVEFLSNKLSS